MALFTCFNMRSGTWGGETNRGGTVKLGDGAGKIDVV